MPDGAARCGTCGQKFTAGERKGGGRPSSPRLKKSAAAAGPFEVGSRVSDRYEVKAVIGEGPIGVTYRAIDREIDVQVALKAINPKLLQEEEERETFRREARIARSLSHPNIIRIYEEGFHEGVPYVVMQHLEGLTLRKIIDLRYGKGQTFTPEELDPIFQQLLAALAYAHDEEGPEGEAITHGNLKPANIIVLPDLLKVTDFREALFVPRVPYVAAQKVRGGNDRYLAPEVVGGEQVAPSADVYSLGVLLGEMLTGKVYDPSRGLDLHVENSAVSRSYDSIFKRLTASNPRNRYRRVSHIVEDLAAAAAGRVPEHVGAFRAEVTRMEKVTQEPAVLESSEFELVADESGGKTPRRKRESYGLDAPAGMDREAPPLDEDEEYQVLDDEVIARELIPDDDEYEDDEYDDHDVPTVGVPIPPPVIDDDDDDVEEYDEPSTVPVTPGLEVLLEKKRREPPELDEPSTAPKAPSLDELLAEGEAETADEEELGDDDVLDEILDSEPATPLGSDTDPDMGRIQQVAPHLAESGPRIIGRPPAELVGEPTTRTQAPRRKTPMWLILLLFLAGMGGVFFIFFRFVPQGQQVWGRLAGQVAVAGTPGTQDPPLDEPPLGPPEGETPGEEAVGDETPEVDLVTDAEDGDDDDGAEPDEDPPVAPPDADTRRVEDVPPRKPATGDARARTLARLQEEERRIAEESRRAGEAARKQAEEAEAARRAAQEEREMKAAAARAAEDEELQRIIAQEQRRQEVERARREGRPPPPPPKPDPTPPPAPTPPPPEPDEGVKVASATPAPGGEDSPRCPKGMAYIPEGSFKIGSAVNDPMRNFAEKALTSTNVKAYCVDRYEYGGGLPVTGVTWFRAKELCERKGRRLCTEEEWEKACKGPRSYRFPYGNVFDAEACNTEDAGGNDRDITRSGTFKRCKSGYGVYDLAGNVAEWTDTLFQSNISDRTQKGGAANRPDWDTRCATRGNRKPNSRDGHLGFRCCADPR